MKKFVTGMSFGILYLSFLSVPVSAQVKIPSSIENIKVKKQVRWDKSKPKNLRGAMVQICSFPVKLDS